MKHLLTSAAVVFLSQALIGCGSDMASSPLFGQGEDSSSSSGNGGGSGSGANSGSGAGSSDSGSTGSSTQSTGSSSGSQSTGSGGEDCESDEESHSGQATWYVLDTPLVNCSYETTTLPQYYGAMNTSQYQDSAICGACVQVDGPNGSVEIQVVDQCPIATNPICYGGHIDLNVPAFEQIADKITGLVPITWKVIPCSGQSNISYQFKEGSSQYWAAIRVRHHRYPIVKLEYKNSDGNFVELERTVYNYFLATDGMGSGPFTLRVTDIYGSELVDNNVPLTVGQESQGAGQFPLCN